MKRVGYIGMGIMGSPMAINLANAGFEVMVWNRTKSKADPALKAGATWANSPAEIAVKAEVVCINVTDTPDVEQIIFGSHGIVEGNPGDTADLVVIDHSTISPTATRDFANRLTENSINMLDAPVSGGDVGAQKGELAIMVGGEKDVFESCLPILQVNGKAVTLVGPSGAGQLTKATNQVLCAVHMVALCEAMALAKKQGLDVQKMLEVTAAGAGGSWALANLGPKVLAGDLKPAFMIDLILKDLEIVRAEARDSCLPMPGTDLATDLFRAAKNMDMGKEGTQAMSKVYEMLGNLKFNK